MENETGRVNQSCRTSREYLAVITNRDNVFKVDRLIKRFDFVGEKHSGGHNVLQEKETAGRLIRSLRIFTEWEENKKLAFHQFLGGDVKGMIISEVLIAEFVLSSDPL